MDHKKRWKKAKNRRWLIVSPHASGFRTVVERVFGRLQSLCPFTAGPIKVTLVDLAHSYIIIYLALFNIELKTNPWLFVRDPATKKPRKSAAAAASSSSTSSSSSSSRARGNDESESDDETDSNGSCDESSESSDDDEATDDALASDSP